MSWGENGGCHGILYIIENPRLVHLNGVDFTAYELYLNEKNEPVRYT